MDRRRFLRGVAGAGALGLAGCLAEDGAPGTDETDEPSDGTDTPDDGTERPTDEAATPTDTAEPTDTPEDPAVVDRSLTVHESDCGRQVDEAAVEFADGVALVTGTTHGSQACYTAKLDGVAYDPDSEALTVAVASVRTAADDEPCADCIAEVEYSVRVAFDSDLPESVRVVHVRGDGRRTVATGERRP